MGTKINMSVDNKNMSTVSENPFSDYMKINFFIALLFSMLIFLPNANAGVTVFDDSKGRDVDAKLERGNLEHLDLKIQSIPRAPTAERPAQQPIQQKKQQPKKKPLSPSDIVLEPWETDYYDLGHVQIFVDGTKSSKAFAKSVQKLQNIEGLRVSCYLKAQKTFREIVNFTRNMLMHTGAGIECATDASNERFKELKMQNHMSVHYTSPFGDVREFPLDNPQYVLNKVDDVRRKIRGEQ